MGRKKYFKDLFWNTLGVSLNSFLIHNNNNNNMNNTNSFDILL